MLNSPALSSRCRGGGGGGGEWQLTDAQFFLTYGHFISVIYPYLFYCVSVWASTYPLNLIKHLHFNYTSKTILRIMSRSAFDVHTDPLFKKLEILNLESIYKLETGKFINTNPAHLPYTVSIICFLVTRQVHSYSNRSSSSELFYFLFFFKKVLYQFPRS